MAHKTIVVQDRDAVEDSKGNVHLVPQKDTKQHYDNATCWCKPTILATTKDGFKVYKHEFSQ
jgi:hypothetical protein